MHKWIALAPASRSLPPQHRFYNRGAAERRPIGCWTAPVDPRSLMRGDYMALRFKVAGIRLRSGKAKGGPTRWRMGAHA